MIALSSFSLNRRGFGLPAWGFGGHGTDFEKTGSGFQQRADGLGILVKAGCKTDRIGEIDACEGCSGSLGDIRAISANQPEPQCREGHPMASLRVDSVDERQSGFFENVQVCLSWQFDDAGTGSIRQGR